MSDQLHGIPIWRCLACGVTVDTLQRPHFNPTSERCMCGEWHWESTGDAEDAQPGQTHDEDAAATDR